MPMQKDGTFRPINIAFPRVALDPGGKRYETHIPNCGLGVSTQSELDKLMIANSDNYPELSEIIRKKLKSVIGALGDLKIMGKEKFLAR